jgi:hypothetical protein
VTLGHNARRTSAEILNLNQQLVIVKANYEAATQKNVFVFLHQSLLPWGHLVIQLVSSPELLAAKTGYSSKQTA